MSIYKEIKSILEKRVIIIDGAMGTQLQEASIPKRAWIDEKEKNQEGCNELLNDTASEIIKEIYDNYAKAGADLITTNTFGTMPWVLEEYQLENRAYELSKKGALLAKEVCKEYKDKFVLGSIGPGTKLPSLGHIDYDTMFKGYKEVALGLIDGKCDIFLLETSQDPLQIKSAIHAIEEANRDKNINLPIMVSVTIELSGTMLIGTDVATIITILEPFNILSLGFNCGTGPEQVEKHLKTLSKLSKFPISIHSNAGLPENREGKTFYPMTPKEFAKKESSFCQFNGVSFLGGCCGTTPEHIKELKKSLENIKPKEPIGKNPPSIASLFQTVELFIKPAPLLIGERSNATGSKAFRELILSQDYEGTLQVAQAQVRDGASVLDVNVEFAGRDGAKDMAEVISRYNQKISIPLMPDATRVETMEMGLKNIGGKAIINSVNLEDGEKKLDEVCKLAKKYGSALVCLVIDETGMAKTKEKKLEVARRIYNLAVNRHKIDPKNLIFDMLTFTVGSGDIEYRFSAIETLEAIRELHQKFPEVGSTLGLSNISFGLSKNARIFLNSIFLHHCLKAGMSSVIINVKHILPLNQISKEERELCEELLFNADENSLFKFIDYFEDKKVDEKKEDESYLKLSDEEKIKKLLLDGDKTRMIPLVEKAKEKIHPDIIVNKILIDAMKVVGELFGKGEMQLPFVLQSAETMKTTVDFLTPYLTKKENSTTTTLILGTVKGDVHDVGKNLVDIILTNNGFKVINIGIKADLNDFLKAIKEHNADALGMSGLLVKSTAIMRDNLEELAKLDIKVPILLGGAALTKNFVDDFCRPIYKGGIFYCKDAFDGVVSMSRIEEFKEGKTNFLNTSLHKEEKRKEEKIKKEIIIPPIEEIKMPQKVEIPNPPFWGRRVLSLNREIVFNWVNKKNVIKLHWGYKKKGMNDEKYSNLLEKDVYPHYERLKREFIDKNIFEPIAIYGYFRCRSDNTNLYILNEKRETIATFKFPRQSKKPHRSISDYFSKEEDIIALSCVSAGLNFTPYEEKLYKDNQYLEYNRVHGLSVELAEALAEVVHKQVRLDLNLVKEDEGNSLKEVRLNRYKGARYSFGYPACPDLEQTKEIFKLLNPEEFGITLSETFQIVPEQSTTALIVHHKEAKYFNI